MGVEGVVVEGEEEEEGVVVEEEEDVAENDRGMAKKKNYCVFYF